jgi:hypothetical protein
LDDDDDVSAHAKMMMMMMPIRGLSDLLTGVLRRPFEKRTAAWWNMMVMMRLL